MAWVKRHLEWNRFGLNKVLQVLANQSETADRGMKGPFSDRAKSKRTNKIIK